MGLWELIQGDLKLDGGGQGGERDRVRPPYSEIQASRKSLLS